MIPSPRLARLFLNLPGKGLLLGGRVVRDGQTLDRTVQWLLALERRVGVPPLTAATVASARASSARTMPLLAPRAPGVVAVDRCVQGPGGPVPLRCYRPPALGGDPTPTLLYLHGGGWVLGDLETHDGVCRALARDAGGQVIAVDYRLAPEHPYPAAVEDAWAAFQAVTGAPEDYGVDPERLAVGGDSAGGNLAAVVARRARDAGLAAPCLQLLVYPCTDNTREAASYETFAEGFLLSRDDVRWFRGHYLPDVTRRAEPDASPLRADDLAGLAPACLLLAGYDPLRDEGLAYAQRLEAAGVTTEAVVFPELVHGFLNMAGAIPACAAAFERAAGALRAAWS